MRAWLVSSLCFLMFPIGKPAYANDAEAIPPTQMNGTFVCMPGPAPAKAANSVETWVIDKSQTGITYVDTAPGTRGKDPSRVKTYCKVADTWCQGISCNDNPKFDFINGGSLTWSRSGNYNSIRFMMVGHNTDKLTDYHMTLYIMPDWPTRSAVAGRRMHKGK